MTIDEAIKHCEERAKASCTECAKEHQQLADWLKELKELRDVLNKKTEVLARNDIDDFEYDKFYDWNTPGIHFAVNKQKYTLKQATEIAIEKCGADMVSVPEEVLYAMYSNEYKGLLLEKHESQDSCPCWVFKLEEDYYKHED